MLQHVCKCHPAEPVSVTAPSSGELLSKLPVALGLTNTAVSVTSIPWNILSAHRVQARLWVVPQ